VLSFQPGDDCIAISGGSSYVNVTGIACGPGHGIRLYMHILKLMHLLLWKHLIAKFVWKYITKKHERGAFFSFITKLV